VAVEGLEDLAALGGDLLAVGHSPKSQLRAQDQALFRAFQANLLSLISHELRTPLTGILNALGMLETTGEEAADLPFTPKELVTMARSNAQRLHRTLVSLLDVAALESGTFHARFREVDLLKLAQGRMEAHEISLKERGLHAMVEQDGGGAVLGDPQKLGRALDLCIEAIAPRAEQGSAIELRISTSGAWLSFTVSAGSASAWQSAWTEALAGYQGGVASPSSAFAGVLQSEQAFLTRMEEGLGSEFMLVHEIMRLHGGSFTEKHQENYDAKHDGRKIELFLSLPALSSEEGLRVVLTSRAYDVSTELKSVALVLIQVPKGTDTDQFVSQIRTNLFRSSDAVYSLPGRAQIALVLDDCKVEDAPRLLTRIKASVTTSLRFGIAHCPGDGLDPSKLFDLADERLKKN
jgi:hypothetical protein